MKTEKAQKLVKGQLVWLVDHELFRMPCQARVIKMDLPTIEVQSLKTKVIRYIGDPDSSGMNFYTYKDIFKTRKGALLGFYKYLKIQEKYLKKELHRVLRSLVNVTSELVE